MKVNARIAKSMNQIIITKQMSTGSFRISTSDAKHLFKTGRITQSNLCFRRLAANDFDVKATLAWYQEERERQAAERASSTDEE